MGYAIWYHLYNLKIVKNTHGGVLILVKLQALACNFTKINTPPWVFFTLFKLYKWYQIAQRITYMHLLFLRRTFHTNYKLNIQTARKVSKYGGFSGPYFLALGLNMERYEVSLCIQSECGKIRTRKHSVFGHLSHNGYFYYLRKRFPSQMFERINTP